MKKIISLILVVVTAIAIFASCNGTTTTAGAKYALVTKAAGNAYNEKEAEGFKAAMEAAGMTANDYIIRHPEQATVEAQIAVINSLISQGVKSIAIAANDPNALSSVLADAKAKGIKILTLDSDVAAADRLTFCNQAGVQQVAQALIDAVLDLTGGECEYAILSATSQATNQNAWIDAMKAIAAADSAKYGKLNLVEVAYGDDEQQKSTDQTQALLAKYPNLKVICAPTTVGIMAAGKVLQDKKSTVKLTGLGLPSEMAAYIGNDADHSCPYMFLWNPIDLGKLAAYASIALVEGKITGAVGDTFEAGNMENSPYTLTAVEGTTASEIILGAPFKFDPSNIGEWKSVY
ncbi:MAG: substrate-binding domain-containing protein [Clostridia bacterium]|nr:substrate-binding domain-containing protein [Clostridia bacterium]